MMGDPNNYYLVTLKMHYETKFGEYLCVTGETNELGKWTNFSCKLKWTEGHVWVTEKPLKFKKHCIQYKYVVL